MISGNVGSIITAGKHKNAFRLLTFNSSLQDGVIKNAQNNIVLVSLVGVFRK